MITRTPASAGSAVIWRSAAMPSSSGIRMSIRITSGRVRRTSSTAARPFSASPASSRSSSDSISTRRPIRTSAWSSARATEMVTRASPPTGSSARTTHARRRAAPRPRRVPPTARARSPIPRMPLPATGSRGGRAVVAHLDHQPSRRRGPPVRSAAAVLGMPDHVGQRLLDDPEGGLVDRRRQRLGCLRRLPDQRRPSGPPGAARRPGRRAGPARARGAARRPGLGIAEHSSVIRSSASASRLVGPDRLQRLGHLVGPPVQHVQRHPGLHGDHRQAVADHVVHVAGDPQPLLVRVPPPVLLAGRLARSPAGCGGAARTWPAPRPARRPSPGRRTGRGRAGRGRARASARP